MYYCFVVFCVGYICLQLLIPCLVSLEETCTSVRCISSCFKKSSWRRSSLLPSVLGLGDLWLIRTTLLFICLTCGNICNLFLVREISAGTWFDFQTHDANENQPPESREVSGEQAKVFYPPLAPSCKHQHLLGVKLKWSCRNSGTETQLQPERGSDVQCVMRAGDCPLLHIVIIQIMKENEMVRADNSCFYSGVLFFFFQRFS